MTCDPPLAGLTVLDLLDAPIAGITRIYAELGAEVLRPEPNGAYAGNDPASPEGIRWLVANIGKTIVTADALPDLVGRANLIVGSLERPIEAPPDDATVVMTVSMFGAGTSYSGWQATDPVLHALIAELSRSGLEGREPLLPPGELAMQCGMVQAAYVGMAALYAARRTGHGDRIDVSMVDAAMQALDPGFGLSGSATLGRAARHLPPGRPAKGLLYPIYPCADGYVRLCLLAPRQWQAMFRWMGEPPAFAGAEFYKTATRQDSPALGDAIAAFVADRPRSLLEDEAMSRGVPLSGLFSLQEGLRSPHVMRRGAVGSPPDRPDGILPNGVIEIDGVRMGPFDKPAPAIDNPTGDMSIDPSRPLAGLRVLDLGVIVVGGEQSRLLADLGADVVKVESGVFPDGTRHSYLPTGLSVSFAAGHRNKRSLGLNLKHADGKALFLRLAAEADVILSNFKPGTMESLGLGYDTLRAINSGIVVVESSAFGATGPWAGRMGYGPLVRAAAGLTAKWRYPDDETSHSDSITIYPDHVAARYGAIAALALLTRRLRSGEGGRASVSQMEVVFAHFAAEIAASSLSISGIDDPPDAPWGVYRAAGSDEWCVVTVRSDAEWQALTKLMSRYDLQGATSAERRHRRVEIDQAVSAWMSTQDADDAMRRLQAIGVAAARMLRVADLPEFGYFQERGFFREDRHPHMDEPITAEHRHAVSSLLADPDSRPAPLTGEHSGAIVREWLGLDDAQVAALFDAGVLEPVAPHIDQMLRAGEGRSPPTP